MMADCMIDTDIIAQCILLCEERISHLEAQRVTARKNQYDRHSVREIDFGLRELRQTIARMRTLQGAQAVTIIKPNNGERLNSAIAALKELRPSIVKSMDSVWKNRMLRIIDALIQSD